MEVTADGFLILSKLDVFLYAVPSKRAEKAKYWDLSQPMWSGNLILLANDGSCIVRMEDEGGVILGQTGVESYPGENLKPVGDSRRYFSLRFSNQVYGIGFVSGEESGKFISAIEDHCLKYRNLSYVPEPGEIEVLHDDRTSLGGKSYVPPGFISFDEMFFAPLHNYEEQGRSGHASTSFGNRLLSELDRDQGLPREKIRVGQMFDFDSRTLRQVQDANTCSVCKKLFKTPEGLQQHSIQKHRREHSEMNYSWLNLETVSIHESASVAHCPVNTSGIKRGNQGHSRRQRKKNPSVLRGVGSVPHRPEIKDQYTSTNGSRRKKKMRKKGSHIFQPMHFVYSHDLHCVNINNRRQ